MASKAKTSAAARKAAPAKKKATPKKVTKAASATSKKAPAKTAAATATKKASPRAAVIKRAVKKAAPKTSGRKSATKSASAAVKKTTPKAANAKNVKAVKKVTARKTTRKAQTVGAIRKAATPGNAGQPRNTLNGSGANTANRKIISEMETMMKQGPIQFDQLAREAGDAGREGVDAFMKSGAIFAKGCEDIIRTATSLAQESAEKQAQYFKDAMSSKTLNEWAEVQNKIAQAGFDDFMEGATKLSEISAKVLSEASEPFNAQMGKAMKKASSAAA